MIIRSKNFGDMAPGPPWLRLWCSFGKSDFHVCCLRKTQDCMYLLCPCIHRVPRR